MTVAILKANRVWPGNYFGSGADGAHTGTTAEEITVTEDAGPAIKHYSSLTFDAAKSLTTNNRCKGLLVYVTGDCTINGTLKMDGKGANASTGGFSLNLSRWESVGGGEAGQGPDPLFPDENNEPQGGGGSDTFTRFKGQATGASGGAGGDPDANGTAGSAGAGSQTGGGGGGGEAVSAVVTTGAKLGPPEPPTVVVPVAAVVLTQLAAAPLVQLVGPMAAPAEVAAALVTLVEPVEPVTAVVLLGRLEQLAPAVRSSLWWAGPHHWLRWHHQHRWRCWWRRRKRVWCCRPRLRWRRIRWRARHHPP